MEKNLKIVKTISELFFKKDIDYLNNYEKYKKFVSSDYDIIKTKAVEINSVVESMNIDIPVDYSEKILKLSSKLSIIQTLKNNIILNFLTLERIYWTTYYSTLHRFREEVKDNIGTKHEWDAAFNLAIHEVIGKDIYAKIEVWKHLIQTSEDLVQATMEIINSAKKSVTVLMDKKW